MHQETVLHIEVPSRNDFLLNSSERKEYKNFLLWSQHLYVYSETGLKILADECKMQTVVVEYRQRYPLDNTLMWLLRGIPTGRNKSIEGLSERTRNSFTEDLVKMKMTDTVTIRMKIR